MIYLEKVQLLITSTTFGEMHIWRIDTARSLLMYPWFIEFQYIKSFPSVTRKVGGGDSQAKQNAIGESNVWITCFDKKIGDTLQILAGDTEGSLYTF